LTERQATLGGYMVSTLQMLKIVREVIGSSNVYLIHFYQDNDCEDDCLEMELFYFQQDNDYYDDDGE
jgi:hypothetical protein